MSQPTVLQTLSDATEAERQRDWKQAAQLHATLRTLSPGQEAGWLGGARVLREERRLDEMEAMLVEAHDHFPASLAVAVEHAAAAVQRGQADEAIRRWKAVVHDFPVHAHVQIGLCATLNSFRRFDEADQLSAELMERLPTHLQAFVEHARTADGRRDWAEAHRRWQFVSERFPDRPVSHVGMAQALREQRKLNEADMLLQNSLQTFPQNRQLLEAAALVAQVRRDWPEAVVRWDALLAVHADSVAGHQGRVTALREAKQLDEAEASLAVASQRLPYSVALLSERAKLASARGDWAQAIEAWEAVRAQTPASPQAVAGIADVLLRQKKYEEAETFLFPEIHRFPDRPDIGISYAQIANRRRMWSEAVVRWGSLETRFPDNAVMLGGMAEALWATKDLQALMPVLDRLLVRDPDNVTAAILYARLELRQNRPADALARLTAADARWPRNSGIMATLNDARMHALVVADEEVNVGAPAHVPARTDKAAASDNLFEQFESLGNGCEFGLLQRKFGAEPLGLLRWGSITPRGLINMLERRFEGVGDVAHTSIKPDGDNYVLSDHQYEMGMQTFIATSTKAADTLLPKLCNRLRYLARELMENMEEADRILVYKIVGQMTEQDVQRLWRAVGNYGKNALLLVKLADAEHPAGSIEIMEDGLMIGAIDHYSNTDMSVDDWTHVCQAASETWEQTRQHRMIMSSRDGWT